MFCAKCGGEIKEGQLFCSGCGSKIVPPSQSDQYGQSSPYSQSNPYSQPTQYAQGNQYGQVSQYAGSYQYAGSHPKQKSSKSIIIIAVAAMLVLGLFAGGGIAAYKFIKSQTTEAEVEYGDIEADNSSESVTTEDIAKNEEADVPENDGTDDSKIVETEVVKTDDTKEESESKDDPEDESEKAKEDEAGEADAPAEDKDAAEDTGATELDDSETIFAGYKDHTYLNYAYADIAYGDDVLYVVPNGKMDDSTVLWNGKTAGAFVDYLENLHLDGFRNINRKLLYELMSVYTIDKSLNSEDDVFEATMVFLLPLANEFNDTDLSIDAMAVTLDEETKYHFKVTMDGKNDVWLSDPLNNKLYQDNEKEEYKNAIFEDRTLGLWYVIVDSYFEIGDHS